MIFENASQSSFQILSSSAKLTRSRDQSIDSQHRKRDLNIHSKCHLMASTFDDWTDDELNIRDDDTDTSDEDVDSLEKRRKSQDKWDVVHHLNKLQWLEVPEDLLVIEKEIGLLPQLTIAHRMLIAFMGWAEKMRPIRDAPTLDIAIERFLHPEYIRGSCEYNQRRKGNENFLNALTNGDRSSRRARLTEYVSRLNKECPLYPDQLIDITTYTRYLSISMQVPHIVHTDALLNPIHASRSILLYISTDTMEPSSISTNITRVWVITTSGSQYAFAFGGVTCVPLKILNMKKCESCFLSASTSTATCVNLEGRSYSSGRNKT